MAKLYWLDSCNLLFFCPGCKCAHYVRVAGPGSVWGWNSNLESPSFSADVTFGAHTANHRCHFRIEQGAIEFFKDSQHTLSGLKVALPEWSLAETGVAQR